MIEKARKLKPRRKGFTLIEIMIVVVIIGLLASIAIPSFAQSKRSSVAARTASDFKKFADLFTHYNLSNGNWPEDGFPGTIPNGMEDLNRGSWMQETAIGGQWDWEYRASGVNAGISIIGVTAGEETLLAIDSLIDDGDLDAGDLIAFGETRICFVMEQ